MDLKQTEARNFCVGEGQQQFNRQIDSQGSLQLVILQTEEFEVGNEC
jgi:hypothetical protein